VSRFIVAAAVTWVVLATAAPVRAADAFAPDSLRAFVTWLADDARQGRGPGTTGLDAAAEAIAARFRAAGLEPAGDGGTFFQNFEVTTGVRPSGVNRLRIGDRNLGFESDWTAYGFSDTGTARATIAFAGYGIRAPEYGYDDYAGIDVRGKVVVVLRFEPGRDDSTSVFEGRLLTPYADLRRKAIEAREAGAVGMLVVTGPAGDEPDRLAKLRADARSHSAGIRCGQVTRAALAAALPGLDIGALQSRIDKSGKPASQLVDGARCEWTVGLVQERTWLRNVVGIVPGADPHRAVVVGAHYDHLGMGGEGSLDPDAHAAHNGADDNASGTAALVALARHFAGGPRPPRTMVFAAFSGEELGLVGSSHYVQAPPVPLQFTTTMLNMDMIGRLRDRKLLVFGADTATQFRAVVDSVNNAGPRFDLTLKGDGYGPSDHMSFFKKNVPVLHFFTGAHSEYHKPSDDAPLLDYDGLAVVARFVGDVALAVQRAPMTFVAATSPEPQRGDSSGGGGFRSYLGTVPDYAQPDSLQGVLLSGVRAGSPAEKAGLRSGDVIVQIDAMTVRNIYDFVHVLETRKPGETLAISVTRAGTRVPLQATLAARP
jgi:hypothetical protein